MWGVYVQVFFKRASHRLVQRWLKDHLTVVAGDFHISCIVNTWSDITYWVEACGIFIDVLRLLDLQVSACKSKVILSLHGKHTRKFLAKYVKHAGRETADFWCP